MAEMPPAVPPATATQEEKLAFIHQCLLGAYEEAGIQHWWDRTRKQLDGKTPRIAVADGEIDTVVGLAAWLLG